MDLNTNWEGTTDPLVRILQSSFLSEGMMYAWTTLFSTPQLAWRRQKHLVAVISKYWEQKKSDICVGMAGIGQN